MRVKDIEFDKQQIVVRDGKGEKDRVTVLPETSKGALLHQIALVKELHKRDLADGYGQGELPYALARKYPKADRETAWQFVFSAHQLSRDVRRGIVRRHHLHPSVFEKAMKVAVKKSGIESSGERGQERCGLIACHSIEEKWVVVEQGRNNAGSLARANSQRGSLARSTTQKELWQVPQQGGVFGEGRYRRKKAANRQRIQS